MQQHHSLNNTRIIKYIITIIFIPDLKSIVPADFNYFLKPNCRYLY